MNALVRHAAFTAPAVPERHRFTFEDVLAMQATGVLDHDTRRELVDGDIIDMPSDGELHREWTGQLLRWLASGLDLTRYGFLANTTLDVGNGWYPSPDVYVVSADKPAADVRGPTVLLVIEQADSSLAGELGDKARRYAEAGVRDYWVIDLNAQRLHVHRDPGADSYRSVHPVEREEPVSALLIPGLSLRIADLPRVG